MSSITRSPVEGPQPEQAASRENIKENHQRENFSLQDKLLTAREFARSLLPDLSVSEKCALLCGKDFWHSHGVERLGLPSLTFSDGPHGLRYQATQSDHLGLHKSVPASCFPTSSALANSWDPLLACTIGTALGREAAALGVDVLLGPGMNIIRNPKGGRNFEYFSEDPLLTGMMAAGMIQGIQRSVSACPKHFLLNSQETSRMTIDERADPAVLHELYLPAFEMAVSQSRPDWIMTSYNKVYGNYASESPDVYRLLQETGHQGGVISDWGGGCSIAKAVRNGQTLEMPGTLGQSEAQLMNALQSGSLSLEELDRQVLVMLERIYEVMQKKEKQIEAPNMFHHHILAVKAAISSSVLLKNNGILPLHHQKIAWVGPFDTDYPIQGGGSSQVIPQVQNRFSSLLKHSTLRSAGIAQGYSLKTRKPATHLEKKAVRLAEKADVIVFLAALPEQEQLEGIDRSAESLPENQQHLLSKLIATGKPVVLVDAIAGPIELKQNQSLAAVLYTGLSGQGAKEALLRILFGQSSPGGYLAQTFARNWKDHPNSSFFPLVDGISNRPEGMHVGYRAFLGEPVLYPFGYGLSYTTFEWTKACINLQDRTVDLWIHNTGSMTGSTLVQIYVQKPGRDYRELAGFQKFLLKPGERRHVKVEITDRAWQFYDSRQNSWRFLEGCLRVELAKNARDMVKIWDVEVLENGELKETVCSSGDRHAEKNLDSSSHIQVSEQHKSFDLQPVMKMDTPLHAFADCRDPLIKNAVCCLLKIRDQSLKKNKPNMLAISLADMPPKGLAKVSPELFTMDIMQALCDQANVPGFVNAARLAGKLIFSRRREKS